MRYNEPKEIIKKIRSLFFKKYTREEIGEKLNLVPRRVGYIITKNKYLIKRERYYRFLINYAYSHNLSIEDIAKKLDLNVSSLTRVKRKNSIKTKRQAPNKRITDDIKSQMIDMYQSGISAKKIAIHFGFSTYKTVLDVLHKHNVNIKSGKCDYTNYNKNVFEKLNSHDKAYVLGLLYTDGYVYKNYAGVNIQLTITDKYLLEHIAQLFGESTSVIDINCNTKRKKIPNAKDMARLGVYCPKIAGDLKKMGVVKNKTHILSIDVKIPKKYIYSFARGIIDGDGTVGIYNKDSLICKFVTMSETFAKQFIQLPFKENFSIHKQKNNIWVVSVLGGNKDIGKFLKKMYKHKNKFYLERKYAKVQSKIC